MSSRVLAALADAPGAGIAVQDEERALDYSALTQAVAEHSAWLQRSGVRRCALLADNSAAWVIADLALLDARALNAPLPSWFSVQQRTHVLDDAQLEHILTDAPERIAAEHPEFTIVDRSPDGRLSLLQRSPREALGLDPRVVKVTYTSGSTGAPKGVCLTLETIEAVACSLADATPPDVTRHLCVMPLPTLLENIAGVYAPLLRGLTCMVPSTRTTGLDYGALNPTALLKAISASAPNSLILVPELLRVLIAASKHGWRAPEQLRFIAVGGARVSPALLEEAASLGLPAYEGYGLSECASVVCLNVPGAARPGSVGRPLPHVQLRIDAHGEIHVRGATMTGYLGDRGAATHEIATGDLGSIDADGYVYVHGRAKNMFITSMGRNVAPEWVESELLREASIGQAIVFGEARPWPIALITPAAPQITLQQIERAVVAANSRLPNYARVQRWTLLPEPLTHRSGLLTANGRPRRAAIAERYAAVIDELYPAALAS